MSCDQSICHPDSPTVYQPISQSHCPSIPQPVHLSSPSIHHTNGLYTLPSLCPGPISLPPHPSVLHNVPQTLCHRPTICTPSYHVRQAVLYCLTVHPPATPVRQTIRLTPTICTMHQSVCQTICHHHTVCTTHQSVHQHVHHQPTV